MLNPSRLYSFLDSKNNYGVHFFDGQKFIQDLALLHQFNSPTFNYFRDTLLTFQQMMSFLKPGEMFGFYIDAVEPNFRFKLEASYHGNTRALIIPDQLVENPEHIKGQARLLKIFPGHATPYSSVIDINDHGTKEIANEILKISYQTQSQIILSDISDQSLLVRKLPLHGGKAVSDNEIEIDDYIKTHHTFFQEAFKRNLNDVEGVVQYFEQKDLAYLHSMEVDFKCSCSHEQMVESIKTLSLADINQVFQSDTEIETKCDYCKKSYKIKRSEIEN